MFHQHPMASKAEHIVTKKKRRSILLLVIFFILIISPLVLLAVGHFLIYSDSPEKVDAVVVLSGEEGARVDEASYWYLNGYANYFVITVTDSEDIGEGRTYSEKLMRIAIEQDVPQDAILFTDGTATSTGEEAQAVLQLAKHRNLQSIMVVTDPYHTRRTRLIFNDVYNGSGISVLVRAVQDHWYQPETWFLSKRGWLATAQEYSKLLVYYLSNAGILN